eukprot:CAMPEP_0201163684 /NCGR_PEP_ID=MMETSP0851-20130426/57404_1 /ASSEMBLY_ACC=CAM_ASM_000631 /TAXON_ID=183588 /ORGANISM="Pseudo-nitzschia fraudulenta, Strain WWA7" /LENGTH=51 /DNA_ID=CAMNT_0047443905 /DNA_START=31 /DNA_END=183 /DNA_ORIENTATION=-
MAVTSDGDPPDPPDPCNANITTNAQSTNTPSVHRINGPVRGQTLERPLNMY